MNQEDYMRQALTLAEMGRGFTNPNPMVGAVIVKENRIIGMGYHRKYGELHAERNALADCRERKENPAGATMYVTLEPCCHYGKTPPCTEAILAAGIARVVVGSRDANPLVGGKGISILKEHGVEVQEGVLEQECLDLNRIFFHYVQTKQPYVVMKYAMTMDGKIATATGASKWITGEAAREQVHRMRHDLMGIMVGIGTVEKDDPMLNCRLPETKNPVRIICDSTLLISPDAKVVQTAKDQRTILATCARDEKKLAKLKESGCEIIQTNPADGRVDLKELMTVLGGQGIDSILLEGGATLNWAALNSGIVNEVHTYIAPKIFGGGQAPSPVAGTGVALPAEGFRLKKRNSRWIGDDLLIESEVL
jgi:diaminohydroxyphosphoribosylaminopyrimidine deaminase/5-amino-6-(5-phosphoribosylamino)uracil reductase